MDGAVEGSFEPLISYPSQVSLRVTLDSTLERHYGKLGCGLGKTGTDTIFAAGVGGERLCLAKKVSVPIFPLVLFWLLLGRWWRSCWCLGLESVRQTSPSPFHADSRGRGAWPASGCSWFMELFRLWRCRRALWELRRFDVFGREFTG